MLVVLLLLGGRAIWLELSRYQLRDVPATPVPAVFPEGTRLLVTRIPVARLAVGDVIDYRHPTTPATPLYVRVASLAASRGSSGYLLTLETGTPGAEPWHAEMFGAVWRVVTVVSSPAARDSTNVPDRHLVTAAPTRVN